MAALNAFARAFWDMPPVTRMYMTASVMTTVAVQLEIISPFQLYFNPKLIFRNHQYWRLLTTFLFFGPVGFNFLFNVIFTYRYCRMLEEEFYRNRTADFFYMFLIGGALMSMLAYFVNLLFLGHAFTIMLVYIWSRRNPRVRMNFFGLLTFQAPYLPWVLLGFSILLGSSTVVDIIGIVVGHFYYFFEDVFPNGPHGFRILETPRFIKAIFTRLGLEEPILDENDRPEILDFANDPPQQPPPPHQTQQHQQQHQAQTDNQREPINQIDSANLATSSDTQTDRGAIDPTEAQNEQQRGGTGSTDNSTQALRARNVTTGETN